jgi:heme/copper-type cytochrome/quinol oxidase subunit 2
MRIDGLLSTIILVSFLVTIVMAVGSYAAYKLRETRRPRAELPVSADASPYFERITADDVS